MSTFVFRKIIYCKVFLSNILLGLTNQNYKYLNKFKSILPELNLNDIILWDNQSD